MNWKNYLSELKRRHVVKAGIAYLVLSWLIIQILSIIFPAFEASPKNLKTAIFILGIGFPIWLIIAWVYDISAKGIHKTEDIAVNANISKKKNLQLNRFIIGGLSIAVFLLVINQFRMKTEMTDKIAAIMNIEFDSSIAVMAFVDRSPEQDQEIFANGISEQIQRQLTNIKDLKVINFNSSLTYKDKGTSNVVIGEELDVSYILRGSVLKSGEMFRVNVDLIDSKTENGIWSKTFDRKMEDILFTYDEIAQIVAQYLKVTVDNNDVRHRKVDPEAYILYLKAEKDVNLWTDSTTLSAERFIRKSLKIDDTYAPAWSILSHIYYKKTYYFTKLRSEDGPIKGIQFAQRAIELDPLLSSGYQWLSDYQWRTRDIVGYQKNLKKALELEPNSAKAIFYAAFCHLRTNKLKKGRQFLKKARVLDPKNIDIILSDGQVELYFENYDEAILSFKAYNDNMFGNHQSYSLIALAYFYEGRPEEALEIVEKEYFEYYKFITKSIILYGMGRKEESDVFLEKLITKNFSIAGFANYTDAGLYNDISSIFAYRGDKDAAFEYLFKSLDWIYAYPQWFFPRLRFKTLHDDPRWDALLDKMGDEFNYNFKPD